MLSDSFSNVLLRIEKEIRQQPGFWKRFLWFLGANYFVISGVVTYAALAFAMSIVPQEYQWLLATASPLVRKVYVWVSVKLGYKASGGASPHKLVINDFLESRHAFFMSVMLGGLATDESAYCIIGMDFLINIYDAYKIIKKTNTGEDG